MFWAVFVPRDLEMPKVTKSFLNFHVVWGRGITRGRGTGSGSPCHH